MSEYTVVVADGVRARFFSLEHAKDPDNESGPKLVEHEGLVNPEKEISPNQRTGNNTSGRTRAPSGGSYAFDDHRTKHELEALRRFAEKVIVKAIKETQKQDARRCLVLAAESKVLGVLRAEIESINTNGLEIRECDCDMAGEPPLRIQQLLAKRNLVPAIKKPARRVRQ
jgi:hypothetical protein